MYTDDRLYRVIYEYFESRISFAVYKYGECLPSIPEIGRFFHMSPAAVYSALELLVRKGHIKITGNQIAVVTCAAKLGDVKEHIAKYFALREEGIKNMIRSASPLMGPLWLEGLKKGTQQDWDKIQNALASPLLGVIPVLVELCSLTLGMLNNKLILNLFWEEVRYLCFPYLTDKRLENQEPMNTGMSNREIIELLREIFFGSYKELMDDLSRFIREEGAKYLIGSSRIPFQWNIYRRRPQIKYSLAGHPIWEMVKEEYQIGTYLSSLPQITQKYHVSVATVWRAPELLSQMGVTQSFHGKGTLVVIRAAKLNFGMPGIPEGMSLYLESPQIFALTICSIIMYTTKECTAEELGRLTGKSIQLIQEKRVHLCFKAYFRWIDQYCPLVTVHECYHKLQRLLTWGYPVMLYQIRNQNIQVRCTGLTKEISTLLCENRLEEFSDAWGRIMEQEGREARKFVSDVKPRPISR